MDMTRRKVMRRLIKIVLILLLCAAAAPFLLPFLWMIDATFRPPIEIFNIPPQIVQRGFASFQSYSLENLESAIFRFNILPAFINSVAFTTASVLLTLLLCSMAAYAFAFLRFPFKRGLFLIVLATMMVPSTTLIVPLYRIMLYLGLVDNPLSLILPYAAAPFAVFMLRQYMIKIPISFVESAKMEGANDFQIHFRIIIPLSMPGMAALSIIQFRAVWNDIMLPLILIRSDSLYTLPLRFQAMDSNSYGVPYGALLATGFISAAVPIIIFLFFQRRFIQSLAGGIKY